MVREGQRGRREPRMWFTEAPGGVSGRWNRRKELVESGLWSSGGSPPHRRGRDRSKVPQDSKSWIIITIIVIVSTNIYCAPNLSQVLNHGEQSPCLHETYI